ncbi:MAG TPA: DegT/DnrJ/EryC1/StrS family aminotransferase [Candidatus Polarisedimenticolia bacterium]|nr:DegT/DnrJ/EryC1/StrS family aminotransferase [Candidatus Polarisedimenticolia bacterium]
MSYRVPFVDPREHYRRIKEEIDFAITDTLAKGDLVLRQQLRDFERHLADFVGVKYAIGVNSCYHALHFSLLAAGVGPGDEVITVGHTFVATVSAIVHTGAKPVLVDVREDYNLDPDRLESAITPKTKAVIPVHLNGRVCEMDRIAALADKHGIAIIEDAAQALGATFRDKRTGSFGLSGCFSFYPFKSLGGLGDGGAVTTNDPQVARFVTLVRFNGEDRQTGEFHHHGYTALLDNVQAAVLDVKLRYLPKWIEHRRQIARLYHEGLEGIADLRLPHFRGDEYIDSYQNYVIRTEQRAALRQHLTEQGVETLVHWPKPMWEHKDLGLDNPGLPETESICREVISLPMSAETTAKHVEVTVASIRDFFTSGAGALRTAAAD